MSLVFEMLNSRHIVRALSSKCSQLLSLSLPQEASSLSSHGTTRNSWLFRRNFVSLQKLDTKKSHPDNRRITREAVDTKRKVLGKLEKKLSLGFTCKRCGTRNTKTISKLSYEMGIVIVRCDGCKNNHLIADHLGWFTTSGEAKNIEQILAAKGEKVEKLQNFREGSIEIFESVQSEESWKSSGDGQA